MSHENLSAVLPKLPVRSTTSHKGTFGRALLVGGSPGMAGAIALSGMAALRSGAGLVTLAVPDRCAEVVAGFEPSYMTLPLASNALGQLAGTAFSELESSARAAQCLGCGPGLGRGEEVQQLVQTMYGSLEQPMVLDADGLNALAASGSSWPLAPAARILTPHPGEFRRLLGQPELDIQGCRQAAQEFARQRHVILVLKGHRTLVTDGHEQFENTTGNPGMATGGTGDVLTGIITALVCQGLSPLDAARLGVHVHGLAGDLAAEQLGQVSLIASDVVRYLPAAFCRL